MGIFLSFSPLPQTYAQKSKLYEVLKIGAGGIIAFPDYDEAGTGLGIFVEPMYQVSDVLEVGIRIEVTRLRDLGIEVDEVEINLGSITASSAQLTGDLYLSDKRLRPFLGTGVGIFMRGRFGWDFADEILKVIDPNNVVNLGISPRMGMKVGNLKFGAIYNATGKDISDYVAIFFGVDVGRGKLFPDT